MFCKALLAAALAATALAGPCKPKTPTLPISPEGTLAPATGFVLKKIAMGHGIQNYTCANTSAPAVAAGALAVLYDVTDMYPLPGKGLPDIAAFNALSSTILHAANIPLNFANAAAADPNNQLPTTDYLVAEGDPFVPEADLTLGEQNFPFLGRHYFDVAGRPTFDLSRTEDKLLASVAKKGEAKVPATADKGVLGTGAVLWLKLDDNAAGIGRGVQVVYRVITAGGVAPSCSVINGPKGNVPYTAFYWFYG